MTPATLRWRPPTRPGEPLTIVVTSRQADVLTGLCHGLSNREIARKLTIAEDSVKTHLKRLYASLGARDRCHAVALCATGEVDVLVRVTQFEIDEAARRRRDLSGGAA